MVSSVHLTKETTLSKLQHHKHEQKSSEFPIELSNFELEAEEENEYDEDFDKHVSSAKFIDRGCFVEVIKNSQDDETIRSSIYSRLVRGPPVYKV